MLPAWILGLTVSDFVMPFAGLIAVYVFVRWINPTMKKFSRLQDDLLGTPERAGVEAKPGIMERVSNIEEDVSEVKAEQATMSAEITELRSTVEAVKQEVTPNHGGSSHDRIMEQIAATQETNNQILTLLARFFGESE